MVFFKSLKAIEARTAVNVCHIFILLMAVVIGTCSAFAGEVESGKLKITLLAGAAIGIIVVLIAVIKGLKPYISFSAYAQREKQAKLRKAYFTTEGDMVERLIKRGFTKNQNDESYSKQYKDKSVIVNFSNWDSYSSEVLYEEAIKLSEETDRKFCTLIYIIATEHPTVPPFEDLLAFESTLYKTVLPCVFDKTTGKIYFDAGIFASSSNKHIKEAFYGCILGADERKFADNPLWDAAKKELHLLENTMLIEEKTDLSAEEKTEEEIALALGESKVWEAEYQLFVKIDGRVYYLYTETNGRRIDIYIDDFVFGEDDPNLETIEKMKTIIKEYYQNRDVILALHTDIYR